MIIQKEIQFKDRIQIIMKEWLESVIIEGCNIYRGRQKIEDIADCLTKSIVKTLISENYISEYDIIWVMDKIHPQIFIWIDKILILKWDILRNHGEQEAFTDSIITELVRFLQREEDFLEFI